jgi:branched-chain amino acid transport system substrate-binding protein
MKLSLDRLFFGHAWVALLACVGAAAWAADPGVSDAELNIGQSITLQGGKNEYGVAAQAGMKLYFDAVNAAGGIHGRKIVVRTLDDDNKNASAEANARKLIQEGAFILFGPIEGGPSTAVAKVAGELKVPLFGPMAGPPGLRRPAQPMVFPVRAEHRDEFHALMNWGKSTGLKTVGFFHVDSDTGRQHVENVRRISAELGLTMVVELPFKPDASDADIDKLVQRVVDKKPDLILNHGAVGLYQKLITQSKAAGSKSTFMAVNSGSSQIAKKLGPLALGMVFAQVVPSPWERKREVAREYQDAARKLNPDAELSYGGMEGYMTAKALAMALRANGRELSRASLVKTLEAANFDLGGVRVRYTPGEHEGSRFVDLSMVSRAGRFIH